MMTEIRILSRGGQGGVTSAKVLAYSGHLGGKFVQAIPKYGAERKGAPLFADVRISDEHVKTHAPVITENTHSWIVLEPSLVETMPFEDITPGTIIVLNSKEVPPVLEDKRNIKIGKVDAVDIALECGLVKSGTVMVSTTMLGAWAKATGLVDLEALINAVKHQFGEGELAEANIRSIKMAYERFTFIN
ncbi:MAG: 2-oxoacid:acceptor oxidoreductase family protein [Candidatus Heimdallarchaeota archaeon]|nr:MAG: 2-oxoacid:acceptor oxidoreductase family protein [Candidatus Heimdallarchaeota archaeon]